MHGSMWRREETRPVGNAVQPGASRRPSSLERHESAIVGYRIDAEAASRVLAVLIRSRQTGAATGLSFAYCGAEVTGTASSPE